MSRIWTLAIATCLSLISKSSLLAATSTFSTGPERPLGIWAVSDYNRPPDNVLETGEGGQKQLVWSAFSGRGRNMAPGKPELDKKEGKCGTKAP